jgi:hypothetical protein
MILVTGCTARDPGTRAAPAPAVDAAPPVPSFRAEIVPVLQKHCASAEGCHGAKPTDSVSLDLRAAAAYGQLVGRQAEMGATPILRVKPHDPAGSLLVHKLTGNLAPKEGKAMPIDPDTGASVEPSPLPAGFVDRVVVPWIEAGAPNN